MRKLLFLLCSFCMILVSGCVKIDSDIKVNSDFSGKWQAVVQSQVGPLSRGDVEQEIRKTGLTGYTVYPISNEGKVIKDKEAKGAFNNWQIEADFKNSQELAKLGHALGTVGGRDIRDVITPLPDNDKVYKFSLGRSPGVTKITLDADISKDTIGGGTLEGNTVTYQEGQEIYFQFTKNTPVLAYIGYFIGFAVLAGGSWYLYKRTKKQGEDIAA